MMPLYCNLHRGRKLPHGVGQDQFGQPVKPGARRRLSPRYYTDQSLNAISMGLTKAEIMNYFAQSQKNGSDVVGMKIRAVRRTTDDKMLEVCRIPHSLNKVSANYFKLEPSEGIIAI